MQTVASILCWLLAVYGASDIIASSRVGAPLRRLFPIRSSDLPGSDGQAVSLPHLIRCVKCLGFWFGALSSPVGPFPELHPALRAPLCGFTASAGCWILLVILTRLGSDRL